MNTEIFFAPSHILEIHIGVYIKRNIIHFNWTTHRFEIGQYGCAFGSRVDNELDGLDVDNGRFESKIMALWKETAFCQ